MTRYDVLEREKIVKERKLDQLEDRSKKNLDVLDRLEKAHEETEREKAEIAAKYAKLVETEQRLRLPEMRQALAASVAKVSKYEKSIEHSQKIIAQVTADNLVFLTKFKDAEEKFRVSELKREELELMVEEQKGPWFDKVRSDIQKQVESDWQKIHRLEDQLSSTEQESQKVVAELTEQVGALGTENASLKERKAEMEAAISTCCSYSLTPLRKHPFPPAPSPRKRPIS